MSIFYLDYENGNDANSGADWANAWKTITNGATAARIAPGDTIRIAKSPDPVSIGNATWTNLSKTVTLAAAQNVTIDLCETAWTANGSGDCTVTRQGVATDAKEGSYCMQFGLDAAVQTSVMQAYFATGTLDLSAYQKISFWIKTEVAILANQWTITLCSDTDGATPVDTFAIPAIPSAGRWVPITLARNGGGNLGSTIQSIAINTGSSAPTASKYIRLDNIIACTTSGLNLQSLISKNVAGDGWYPIKSIVGTSVLLDNGASSKANAGLGYYGTTETVTTYARETTKTNMLGNTYDPVGTITDSGSGGGGDITYTGGWNVATTLRDGITFFDGLNWNGDGLFSSAKSRVTVANIGVVRYYNGVNISNASSRFTLSNIYAICCDGTGVYINSSYEITIDCCYVYNCASYGLYGSSHRAIRISNAICENNYSYAIYMSTRRGCVYIIDTKLNNNINYGLALLGNHCRIVRTTAKSNSSGGFYFDGGPIYLFNCETSGNGSYGVYSSCGYVFLVDSTLGEATEINAPTAGEDYRVCSQNHDDTLGNHRIVTDGGVIASDASNRHTASGIAWKLSPTSNTRTDMYPLWFPVSRVYVSGSGNVNIKAWVKKTHATDIGCKIVCRGGQVAGMDSDITATAADSTDYQELTLTLTPTAAGVVEIEAWAYWQANTADESVYVDDLTLPTGVATDTMDVAWQGQPWAQNAPAAGGAAGTRAYAFIGG